MSIVMDYLYFKKCNKDQILSILYTDLNVKEKELLL